MLSGRLVGLFGELPDQFLEGVPHDVVGDGVGVQVVIGELRDDLMQETADLEAPDLFLEAELSQDLTYVVRKAVDVLREVVLLVLRSSRDARKGVRSLVVKRVTRFGGQERVRLHALRRPALMRLQDLRTRGFQHALQPAATR